MLDCRVSRAAASGVENVMIAGISQSAARMACCMPRGIGALPAIEIARPLDRSLLFESSFESYFLFY